MMKGRRVDTVGRKDGHDDERRRGIKVGKGEGGWRKKNAMTGR
jgi:hypothetical protein